MVHSTGTVPPSLHQFTPCCHAPLDSIPITGNLGAHGSVQQRLSAVLAAACSCPAGTVALRINDSSFRPKTFSMNPRHYVYRVDHDLGFAPHISGNLCTVCG